MNQLAYKCNCPLVHSIGTDANCAIGPHCSRRKKDPEKEIGNGGSQIQSPVASEALTSHGCDKGGNLVSTHQSCPVI